MQFVWDASRHALACGRKKTAAAAAAALDEEPQLVVREYLHNNDRWVV